MRIIKRRSVVALALGVSLALGAAACGSDESTSEQPANGQSASGGLPATIPLALLQDGTGPLAFYGTQLTAGVKAGIQAVEDSGILGDSKFELSITDSASAATTARTEFPKILAAKPAAVIGPAISNEALATAPLAEAAKIPYLVGTEMPGQEGDYLYSLTTPQTAQLKALVSSVIAKEHGTISVIYANDNATTSENEKVIVPYLAEAGIKIVDKVGVALATTELAAVATKVIDGNPDAILLISGGPQMPAAVKALRLAGYQGRLYGTGGADGTIDSAESYADGFVYTAEWAPGLTGESSQVFEKTFTAVNPDVSPHYPAVDGYNAVLFLAQALAKAGTTDHEALNEALGSVADEGFDGAGGKVEFGGDDGYRHAYGPVVFAEFHEGAVRTLDTAPAPIG